jgi:DNA-binding HxlR family transcriptional regulator
VTPEQHRQVCRRYAAAADLFGRRWSVTVLAALVERPTVRFNQLRDSVPGITPKLLAERLRDLEAAGIVERRLVLQRPVLIEYRLTEKGLALSRVVAAIQEWADIWV